MIAHVTRREMYDLVWAEPLEAVAAKLGTSHWRLKDLCVRHRVPLPTTAYWRDKAAGKRPRQTIFASSADSAVELISLDPTSPSDPIVEERLQQARKAATAPRRLLKPREPNTRTIEWSRIDKPHTAVSLTAHTLRRAKPDHDGIIAISGEGLLSMRLGAGSIERAIFILDSIARGLEAREISCTFAGKHVEVRRGVDKVPFILAETIKRQKHEPTVDELKAEERYRRSARYRDWAFTYERQYPEFDYIATGELTISIEAWSTDQRRRNWRDNTRATLEAQLDPIIEELRGWIDYRRDDRLKDERNARLRRRAEENRKRTEARTKREEERDELLDEIVEMGRKAEQLRSWMAWAADIEDTETQRMLDWARRRLGELERALDPASFGDWLRERTLFPEVDPFAPLPADPDQETPPPQDGAA
ncbi:hypothetical protein NVS89_09410 [Ancylobacter sp. MQZ15Z-1]|uniref:Uncharacterized protein n=1 Tax=Ancylobacter mangrovi TaxID=2972472 RepID=A0A9X2PFZ7_9HYPH|nr:hypothetical protein [Ancylobacter mangrovi]MCS0495315.1 hypothetical protein [Ancylobacter mangrovi]